MNTVNVAVLGATGAVGQRFIQLLENHPFLRVAAVIGSDRSAGRTYGEAARWVLGGTPPADVAGMTVLPLDAAPDTPIIFSALPADIARERELELAAAGHFVFSNASAHRMAPDVPLLLPEVNLEHLDLVRVQQQKRGWSGALVTNSNCTVMPLVMALAPLRRFGITQVNVVSMQAISGAGYPGVASLDIFDNVIPFIPGEEEKLEAEARKMLGVFDGEQVRPLEALISASCNRVPVLDGHTVVASVALAENPPLDEVRQAWETFRSPEQVACLPSAPNPPLVVHTLPDRPQPRRDRDAGKGMATSIGRLRECPVLGYKFVALAHNTVRGAAGASILNAELMVTQGYL